MEEEATNVKVGIDIQKQVIHNLYLNFEDLKIKKQLKFSVSQNAS